MTFPDTGIGYAHRYPPSAWSVAPAADQLSREGFNSRVECSADSTRQSLCRGWSGIGGTHVVASARMGRAFVLLLLMASAAIGQEQQEELVLVGRVTKIVDGDTIDVKLDSGPMRVRFDSIDAPERAQPGGREATESLSRVLGGVGGEVELSVSEQDRYERLVATVYYGGVDVNAWLVRGGHAWAYRAYLNDEGMVALEEQARRERIGLWSASKPIPPWEWRRGHREQAKDFDDRDEFELPGPDAAAPNLVCGAKRYCADMSSCDEAKFFLKMCGLSRLDGDSDGMPCEALCR